MLNIQRDIFPKQRATSSSRPQAALPVIDQRAAQKTSDTFTAGTDFTIPAGAAGTSVQINLPNSPILGNYGRTGAFGNSTFSFGGAAATTFATEVAFVADSSNLGGDVSGLSNGQFMIDYEAAIVYAKKADAGTTGTCTYTFLALVSASSGGGDVVGPGSSTDNAVARFDGTTGKLLQNSVVIISDLGAVTGVTDLTASGTVRANTSFVLEETGVGTDTITLQAPSSIAASYTLTLPVDDGTSGQVLTTDGSGVLSWTTNGAGDVVGPGSSTDNAIARFDSTTGKLIQNSVVIVDDTGGITGVTDLTASGTIRANTAFVLEETGAGTDTITLQAPASIASSYTLTLPTTDGSSGEFLQTDGSGVLSWASAASGFTWSEVTGTSQAAAVNNGYIANNAGLVTITLPDTAALGSIVRVAGLGAGGWLIAQNASEIIHFGNQVTTTGVGGSLASINRYDAVELVCVVANTEWAVISSQGSLTIV